MTVVTPRGYPCRVDFGGSTAKSAKGPSLTPCSGGSALARGTAQSPTTAPQEMNAQAGVERALDAMPPLIADSLLDHFDVALKPGVDLSALD